MSEEELPDMVGITSENATMGVLIVTVQEMIKDFQREHKGMLPAELDARMELALNQLKKSSENINTVGRYLDAAMMGDKMEYPVVYPYQLIEAAPELAGYVTDRCVQLKFPKNGDQPARTIWYPKNFVSIVPEQGCVVLRYYPNWTFMYQEVDPDHFTRIKGAESGKVKAYDFLEMVESANETYGFGRQLIKNESGPRRFEEPHPKHSLKL